MVKIVGNIKFDSQKIKKLDHFTINKNYSNEIDKYFQAKLIGMPTTKPKKKR